MVRLRRPNLLIIGASGGVARAFLRRLPGLRVHFGRLVLVDKNRRVVADRHLDHARLNYEFVQRRLNLPQDEAWFLRLLKSHRIHMVLDVSTHPTLPMLEAVERAGLAYVNTSLNDPRLEVTELIERIDKLRERTASAPRILCAGMNPGVVDLWVRHGVKQFGVPKQIVHLEYDTSMTMDQWRPLVTWCKHEFLTETTWDRTGVFDGKGVALSAKNSVQNLESLTPYLAPLLPGQKFPDAFVVLHEENITVGRALRVPSRFLYALHPRTMRYLVRRFRQQGTLRLRDIELGDNLARRLNGTDFVAVCLEYPRRRIYYANRMDNRSLIGTNATCAQVAVGVYCALFTLMYDRLQPRMYYTGELYDTLYRQLVFANLRVEMFQCTRRGRRWVVRRHVPEVRLRQWRGAPQVVI
ncbi:MAG: saccharopine dehydrogenase NADP-binding domain-containing protein [Verrucomicrobiae bacterium]|nr:saccharopine dehydrogenase NADP-binding domain-containing protein [Verrucomicrobiae bacterium]